MSSLENRKKKKKKKKKNSRKLNGVWVLQRIKRLKFGDFKNTVA